MCCLAMQGGNVALDTLYQLEKQPRPWMKNLCVGPASYAQIGGWTFNSKKERQQLIFDTCYNFKHGDKRLQEGAGRIFRKREDKCGHCGGNLVDVLTLDGRDEALKFLHLDGIFTAVCCPNCVAFTNGEFSRFYLDGRSELLQSELELDDVENYLGDELDRICQNDFILDKTARPVFYGAHCEDLHTIGGFANWVQDSEFLQCLECGRLMEYVGQVQWGALDWGEGTLYVEVCRHCHVAGVLHQQT